MIFIIYRVLVYMKILFFYRKKKKKRENDFSLLKTLVEERFKVCEHDSIFFFFFF